MLKNKKYQILKNLCEHLGNLLKVKYVTGTMNNGAILFVIIYIYIYIYSRRRTRWTWVVVTQSFTRYAIVRQLV